MRLKMYRNFTKEPSINNKTEYLTTISNMIYLAAGVLPCKGRNYDVKYKTNIKVM